MGRGRYFCRKFSTSFKATQAEIILLYSFSQLENAHLKEMDLVVLTKANLFKLIDFTICIKKMIKAIMLFHKKVVNFYMKINGFHSRTSL